MKVSWRVLMLLLPALAGSCKKSGGDAPESYVVLVSFDGFRWDYTDLYMTPNFDDMAHQGVRAKHLIPSFPTKTFPNHFALATGLYPDHNGIINNSFYAPELNGVYRMGDQEMVTNQDAYFGEPIWVTAEEQGIKSATYFWVGSEADIMGTSPSYRYTYDSDVPYTDRVDQVIKWLKMPVDKRPGLLMLYFDEPDGAGHTYGPEEEKTGEMATYADSVLGYLRKEISNLDYGNRVNLIVLSDHGMGPISADRYVNLKDYIKENWAISIVGGNPVYLVQPEEGCADSITVALNAIVGVNAWQKEDIPGRLHYGDSPRFPGIVVVADSTWSIGTRPDASGYTGGAHGYDNAYTDMYAIFYAEGPAFKKNYTAEPFFNVEVYGIVAHLLGLNPALTDGNIENVSDIFK